MTPPAGTGRLLQTRRTFARVLLVWAAATGALILLDDSLETFSMPSWWQPPLLALILGLLAAVVWPLVLRVALPLAFFTLGLGGFVLLGAAVLGISFAIPGVVIARLWTAVVVILVMAAVAGVVSSLLAIDEDELFFRRARRRAARAGNAEPSPPGVLLLLIDGLGYETVRRALRDGLMPTLASWQREGSHALQPWHTDWSSQTAASVCAILHGSNHDILGFRWYEKDRDHVVAAAHPVDAAEIERRHSDGRGLLAGGGAVHGTLFTGDADHVSMTMSSLAHVVPKASRRERRFDPAGTGYYAYFANPVNAVRTVAVSLVEVVREIRASARERRDDIRPRVSRGGIYPLARPGVTVITRDIVTSALIEDMLLGRPVAFVDFLGYDEVGHHTGVERFDALEVLRSIDQQIGRLQRATELAPREYHLVALSDHGLTQGETFADRFGETIEQYVGRLCGGGEVDQKKLPGPTTSRRPIEGWQLTSTFAGGAGPIARRLRERVAAVPSDGHAEHAANGEAKVPRVAPGVVCIVSGHVAMVSFPDIPGRVPLEEIERHWPDLLPGLVDHDGVGFLLVQTLEHGPVVFGRAGVHRIDTGEVSGEDPLALYGPHAPELIARTSSFPHCPDILINSRYDPETDEAPPFEPHVGSHGGLGGPQQHGFLMYPRSFAAPGDILGAEHLHRVLRGWLTDLGHPEPTGEGATVGADSATALRKAAAEV